jgi:hypothetical protein
MRPVVNTEPADPALNRAAYFVMAYAVIDGISAIVITAMPCATCTDLQNATRMGALFGALVADTAIGVFAFIGKQRRIGFFITVLVLLSIRLLVSLAMRNVILIILTVFFTYWAYAGVAACVRLNRNERLRATVDNKVV